MLRGLEDLIQHLQLELLELLLERGGLVDLRRGLDYEPDDVARTPRGTRDVLRLVIKTTAKICQSTTFKQKFEELQLELLDEFFEITKHAPQRWMSLVRTMERIIRLWHVVRKLFADDGEEFPLDKDNNKDVILQLYSLLQPLSAITRDGQYSAVPMTGEMRLAFAELKVDKAVAGVRHPHGAGFRGSGAGG